MTYPDLSPTGTSESFQTLDWLPVRLLYGSTFPNYYGANTAYPGPLSAADMARIYWQPASFVLRSIVINSAPYGSQYVAGPMSNAGFRPNGLANQREATQAYQLLSPANDNFIQGVGGRLQLTFDVLGAGTFGEVDTEFNLNFVFMPIVAMRGVEPETHFYPQLSMELTVSFGSGNPVVTASTNAGADTDAYTVHQSGTLFVCYSDASQVGGVFQLYTKYPNSGYEGDIAPALDCVVNIDYAPWRFAD